MNSDYKIKKVMSITTVNLNTQHLNSFNLYTLTYKMDKMYMGEWILIAHTKSLTTSHIHV